ncbi:hypothetical protein [Priestia abyssalis]|uniref:hypothetical protein n=1 Tax=Priestia abyssalis TaxID=1221450 RepID=UPI000994DAA2|nr:hypothetical protein [Priestia abyssalis]
MTIPKTNRLFSAFRYLLVLYAVLFAMLFSALIPVVFGFQVSIVHKERNINSQVPNGSIVISKPLENEEAVSTELVLKQKGMGDHQKHNQEWMPILIETKSTWPGTNEELWKGAYLYHIPFVGYMIEPLKQAVTPLLMCCILLYLFTYTLHQPKKTK